MIEDMGTIVKIDDKKVLNVKVDGFDSCETCVISSNCAQKRGEVLAVPYKEGFNVGDRVKIKIYHVSLLNASIMIYLIPLIIFVSTILISYFFLFFKFDELLKATFSFGLSIILLIVYGFILRIYDKINMKKLRYDLEKIQ